jgi:hypothetical protein
MCGIVMINTKVTRILCLYLSVMIWLLRFSLRKETKMRTRHIYIYIYINENISRVEAWALMALYMNSLVPKQIIYLLIAWSQTTSQKKCSNFSLFVPRFFDPSMGLVWSGSKYGQFPNNKTSTYRGRHIEL